MYFQEAFIVICVIDSSNASEGLQNMVSKYDGAIPLFAQEPFDCPDTTYLSIRSAKWLPDVRQTVDL